jgi:peptidyl-prolyl cis-trans isomerase C
MAVAETASIPAGNGELSAKLRRVARTALREPLLHFLLLGGVIFAIGDYRAQSLQQNEIVVDQARLSHLVETYRQQFGTAPSRVTLETLLDRDVQDEIYYREGVANGLDKDDQVIRRRVVQKMQFLEQDLAAPAAPSEQDLRRYYASHISRYEALARVSFSQIYFSPDKGGDAVARARALAALANLTAATPRAPERGDPYPDLYDYAAIDPDAATRIFGQQPIAQALFRAPLERWSGPFRSGYGWHLVFVNAAVPAHRAAFDAVRDTVRTDFLAEAQDAANAKAFATLKARYHVTNTSGAPLQ